MTDQKGLPTVNSKAVYDSTEMPFITTSCLAERFDFRPVLAIISSAIVHPPHDRRHARALKLSGHDAQLLVQFFDFLIITPVTARSRNFISKAFAKSVIPQPNAVVYSQRLPIGGRSTARARVAIEAVRKTSAARLAALPIVPTKAGIGYSTGILTLIESVAAVR